MSPRCAAISKASSAQGVDGDGGSGRDTGSCVGCTGAPCSPSTSTETDDVLARLASTRACCADGGTRGESTTSCPGALATSAFCPLCGDASGEGCGNAVAGRDIVGSRRGVPATCPCPGSTMLALPVRARGFRRRCERGGVSHACSGTPPTCLIDASRSGEAGPRVVLRRPAPPDCDSLRCRRGAVDVRCFRRACP